MTVLPLITAVWVELWENSYFCDFSAQLSQIVFSAFLTVLRLVTTVWPEMTENSYLRDFSAQVSQNRFLSLFDRFTVYYNNMTWNIRKVISPQFQYTSITNRFLSLVDRKLLSPRLQCTSITNRFLSLFDRFTAYYNCMTWNIR